MGIGMLTQQMIVNTTLITAAQNVSSFERTAIAFPPTGKKTLVCRRFKLKRNPAIVEKMIKA